MALNDEFLEPNERILYQTHQHLIILVSHIVSKLALVVILIATGIVSSTAFANNTSPMLVGFTPGQLIPILAGVICLMLLVSTIADVMDWKHRYYLITERRLIQIAGGLSRTICDMPIDRMSESTLSQSLVGRLVGYGTLVVATTGTNGGMTIDNIAHPDRFRQALLEARQSFDSAFGYLESHMPQVVPDGAINGQAGTSSPAPSAINRALDELASLRDRGILSVDEFEARKHELLSR